MVSDEQEGEEIMIMIKKDKIVKRLEKGCSQKWFRRRW
jgi:hypothetical protein